MILSTAWEATGQPSIAHAIVSVLLLLAAIVSAISVVGGAVTWLILPRFKAWLRAEIAGPVQETHKSVTVNGGKSSPPTLLDKVHNLSSLVEQLLVQAGTNATRTAELGDRLEEIGDKLDEHEAKGEQYLGKVRLVMKTQGIDIPDSHSDE